MDICSLIYLSWTFISFPYLAIMKNAAYGYLCADLGVDICCKFSWVYTPARWGISDLYGYSRLNFLRNCPTLIHLDLFTYKIAGHTSLRNTARPHHKNTKQNKNTKWPQMFLKIGNHPNSKMHLVHLTFQTSQFNNITHCRVPMVPFLVMWSTGSHGSSLLPSTIRQDSTIYHCPRERSTFQIPRQFPLSALLLHRSKVRNIISWTIVFLGYTFTEYWKISI